MTSRSVALMAGVSVAAGLLLSLPACKSCGGGGGGITIPATDGSPPELTLGVAQPGGASVTVSGTQTATQSMQLTSKTGPLNLLATAKDPQSGIQAVEIWVNSKKTTCNAAGLCTTTGPGLLGQPMFQSTVPKKNPGDTAVESSILAQALDLTTNIPQGGPPAGGTLTFTLIINAVAKNHLGGQTQTPMVEATWKEP